MAGRGEDSHTTRYSVFGQDRLSPTLRYMHHYNRLARSGFERREINKGGAAASDVDAAGDQVYGGNTTAVVPRYYYDAATGTYRHHDLPPFPEAVSAVQEHLRSRHIRAQIREDHREYQEKIQRMRDLYTARQRMEVARAAGASTERPIPFQPNPAQQHP